MQHRTVLEYRGYRYLKIAVVIALACIIAYLVQDAPVGRYGGTPVGYALGGVAAAFVLWLMWFGVRKRQYKASLTTTQGWLSAHIYFGATLIIVTTLHAGFQLGWNVHTLAYVLLLAVVFSGFFGVYAYLRFPTLQKENLGADVREGLLQNIAELNKLLSQHALTMPDNIAVAVNNSIRNTAIGGGVIKQLRGQHQGCPTERAIVVIEAVNSGKERAYAGEQAQTLRLLYDVMLRKQKVVMRLRRDIRITAIMQIWLYLHVPLSFGLLAALVAHIVAVFFYW
jgi:hypothetical protein